MQTVLDADRARAGGIGACRVGGGSFSSRVRVVCQVASSWRRNLAAVFYACVHDQVSTHAQRRCWPAARPVAIPDDLDRRDEPRARGVVVLPLRVRWSGPLRRYDLGQRADRALVYEQVLVEGTEDDVRWFIDVDQCRAVA